MKDTTSLVTNGRPKIGGAIHVAPIGTTLPTDATSDLDAAFVSLGYVSEDGLSNENAMDTDNVKAWGGDTVLIVQTSKDDQFTFTLIQATDTDVLKFVYGDDNVSGDLDTGITVKANAQEAEERSIVIDMVMKNDVLKRIVIPQAKVTDLGEITYNDTDPVGYETTVTCTPDSDENTHYEYIQKKAVA